MTSKQKLKQLLNTPELMQLLQDEQWDELMNKLPIQTRPVLLELLRDCGVEETEVTRLQLKYGIMYGLKHTSSTITIGAPDKNGIHNVGNVSNQGMQGGRQLGFMTPAEAEHIANQIGNPHVYTMQPKTVVTYTWIKVDTIYGPAYAALEAIGKFKNLNSTLKEKSARLKELQSQLENAKRLKIKPQEDPAVRLAAGKENLEHLKLTRQLFEKEFEANGLEFSFMPGYTRSSWEEICDEISTGKRTSAYFRYEITNCLDLSSDFRYNTYQEVIKHVPKDKVTWNVWGGKDNTQEVSISFDCTYDCSEATRAKQDVIKRAEKTIIELTAELDKLRSELAT